MMTYNTPEGYNPHDYQKLVAFLEQTDKEGVKNGKKCSDNYNPNDPTTWGTYWKGERFQWVESDGELRIQRIRLYWCGLCGNIDVSGCTALKTLLCYDSTLTSINASGCTALEEMLYNSQTLIDISGCIKFRLYDTIVKDGVITAAKR